MRTPGGEIRLDEAGRANGRGAYVCRDDACIDTAIRRGALGRALSTTIPPDLATQLRAQLPSPSGSSHPELTTAGGTIGQE